MNLLNMTGGCRRTMIALVTIVGSFVFGVIMKIDVSNTVASIAIALAATNGAESAFKSKAGTQNAKKSKNPNASTDADA